MGVWVNDILFSRLGGGDLCMGQGDWGSMNRVAHRSPQGGLSVPTIFFMLRASPTAFKKYELRYYFVDLDLDFYPSHRSRSRI